MYHMIQKSTQFKVIEVFFKEPTAIHFIREISKKIKIAPTSVRLNIKNLLKEGLIIKKKSNPFDGYIGNRENDRFLFCKRAYNLYNLYELKEKIINLLHPKAIILFGSYAIGEDIESSDIDLIILSKIRKDIDFSTIEKDVQRKINIMIIENLNKLDENIKNKVINGVILYGGI